MFVIPGEVLWPTAAFGSIIALVFGGIALLRLLPHRSGLAGRRERELLEELHDRIGQLEQLQQRVSELEERVDFAERILAKRGDDRRLAPPQEPPPQP
jgi:hypothetical protein